MGLIMSSLDHCRASVDLRGQLAFSSRQIPGLLKALLACPRVEGCVLVSTCNRTELYLSGSGETPWRLLCRAAGVKENSFIPESVEGEGLYGKGGDSSLFLTETGAEAARHLLQVACGLHSQIFGEEQIITQVRNAIELAQEAGTATPELSALFRQAVTAGKRARSQVPVKKGSPSLGSRCRDVLAEQLGGLAGKKILVTGNGQMGRLAAGLLREAGARVWVTLRSYRHGETVVPAGCGTVPYEDRVKALEGMDALVSATASPHYTLTQEQLSGVKQKPKVLVDLAVPRDIEPACKSLALCFDADALGRELPESREEFQAMEAIVEEELEKYLQWQRRRDLPRRPLRFPLFLDLTGKLVVLVGGGVIAQRRIGTLRNFGCQIKVVSPRLLPDPEGLCWVPREYRTGDLQGAVLAIAATSSREVNHRVGQDAKALGIPVSVADCEAECSFYFPAICLGEDLVAGVTSSGKDHRKTARAAKEIRKLLEDFS